MEKQEMEMEVDTELETEMLLDLPILRLSV